MWPFSRKKNDLVTVSLTPQNITCSCINTGEQTPVLKAYKRIPLKHLEFAQAIPFNQTKLSKEIALFLTEHQLHDVDLVLALSGPKIFETVITLQESSPERSDFDFPGMQEMNWNFAYLCPSGRNGFDFFVCGMRQEHLLSYQLLLHRCKASVATITAGKLAYLHLYKNIKGASFRQSELSLDLLHHRYDLTSLVNAELLAKSIEIHPNLQLDLTTEHTFLSQSLGLFFSERSV